MSSFLLWVVANILSPIVIITKAVKITTLANVVYFCDNVLMDYLSLCLNSYTKCTDDKVEILEYSSPDRITSKMLIYT